MIESVLIDPVLFVRWRETCLASDVPSIMRKTEEARGIVGNRLVYVSIIPVGVPPPDSDARAALREGTQHAKDNCASIHLVIEGGGLRRALIRSVSAGLMLASGGGFHVHADLRDALTTATKKVPLDVEAILAEAAEAGLVGESS